MKDWNGNFEMVNPAEIVIDHRYQRAERPALIATIASSPMWEPFGIVTCIRRANGMLYAVDGQQRLQGVLTAQEPPKRIPVIWFPVLTLEDEARIFTAINEQRKALFPMEKHTSRVVWKEPAALAIERALDKAGFSIGDGGQSTNSRTIKAVGALNYVYNLIGEDGVVQVLVVIREAWPDERSALGPLILKGIAELVAETNGNWNRAKIVAGLSRTSASRIIRKAEELAFDMGGTKQANIRRAFKVLAKV